MAKVKLDEQGPMGGGSVHKMINDLVQLQELCVAKAQQEAGQGGKRLGQLDASIKALSDDLPETVELAFSKLHNKGLLCIVPVSNNVCTACGMGLPKSMVQSIRMADRLHACPSCARMLYYPEVDIRGKGRRVPRGAPPKTGIARFSAPELMIPKLEGTTKEEVLTEMTDKLAEEGFIESASQVFEEAMNREAISSTSLDHGMAFPHVRGVEGGGLMMTLGMSKKGIKFDDSGRNLSRIFFFMVIPTASSAFYLKLLSGLTQTFRDPEHRETLMEETTPEGVWKALVKMTRTTIK